MESNKKPRGMYNTPVQPGAQYSSMLVAGTGSQFGTPAAPMTTTRNGDILDYLKGRGGRIKELEDTVAEQKAANDKLAAQLAAAQEQCRQLQQQLASNATGLAASPNIQQSHNQPQQQQQLAYIAELEQLVNQQLNKVVALEQELAVTREKAATVDVELATTKEAMSMQRIEAEQAAREGTLAREALHRELTLLKSECAEKVARAGMQAKLEAAKSAAATESQLSAATALRQAQDRLSAQATEISALTEQLGRARTALAAAAAANLNTTETTHANQAANNPSPAMATQVAQLQNELAKRDLELSELRAALATANNAAVTLGAVSLQPVNRPSSQGDADPAAHSTVAAQKEVAELKALLVARDSSLIELQSSLSQATAREASLSEQVAKLKAELLAAQSGQHIAQRKFDVLTKERDSLRAALCAPVPGSEGGGADSISARLAAAQATSRAAQAESQVLQLSQELDRLQTELLAQSRKEAEAKGTAEAATSRAATAETRVKRLEAEADSLAREVAGLQEKLGRGEFNRSGNVRVLHLRMNPESEYQRQASQAEVGALQAKADALSTSLAECQAALATMEARALAAEAAAGNATRTPDASRVSASGASSSAELLSRLAARDAEVAVLRHQLNEANKSSVRLREVFKERAAAFREAVYCLFGYRLDMSSEATPASAAGSAPTTFNLRPQHTDSPDDVLIFRYTKEGGMQLVPTPFTTNKLAREVETFLGRFHCIPALTANLTMESFQKQTQC